MEIKKTITLNVAKSGKQIICDDLDTLLLIMSSKGVQGNFEYYGIKKVKNKFVVSIDTIKGRIRVLTQRKDKIDKSLEIMRQIVR